MQLNLKMKTYLIVDDDDDVETILISDDEQKRKKPRISYVEMLTDVETEASTDDDWQENGNQCETCRKTFLSPFNLRRHHTLVKCRPRRRRRRRNFSKGSVECEKCGRRFYQPCNLTRHQKFVVCTPREKCVSEKLCYVCGDICESQSALNAHLSVHFSYRCFCGQLFDTLEGYSTHRLHRCASKCHPKRYECYDCGKKYIKKDDLIRHLGKEHKKTDVYICFHCDKVCVLKKDFLKHISKCTTRKNK